MSNDPDKQAALFAAIARAIATAKSVEKGSENTYHRYKYASAESLIEEARSPLAAEGVCVLPSSWRVSPREGDSGYFADVDVTYLVAHSGGGSITCEARTPAIREKGRPEDKAVATALTYSLGYFLRGMLMLPRVDADHDVDKRDDRNYEPQRGQRQDARPADRQAGSKQDKTQPHGPAAHVPAFDVEKVITQIRGSQDVQKLRLIADEINANAPKADKPRLNQEYQRRKGELLKAQAERDAQAGRAA